MTAGTRESLHSFLVQNEHLTPARADAQCNDVHLFLAVRLGYDWAKWEQRMLAQGRLQNR